MITRLVSATVQDLTQPCTTCGRAARLHAAFDNKICGRPHVI